MAETVKDNSPYKGKLGGARPGAGRPKGSMNAATKERMKVKQAFIDRVNRNADKLFHAQMAVAEGTQLLFRVDKDDKGKNLPAVQVTDLEEIKSYIDGDADKDSYYFITTERPNNSAIDSMLNRSFGKPEEKLDITSKDKPIPVLGGIIVPTNDGTAQDSGDGESDTDSPGGDVGGEDDSDTPAADTDSPDQG